MTQQTRIFDTSKTYYLAPDRKQSDAFCGVSDVNEFLAPLPPCAPVKVGDTKPDSDGYVWVTPVAGPGDGAYVLAERIRDDIPGAAEVRPVKKGDRIVILCGISDLVQACPYGIAEEGEKESSQPGRLLFKFDNPPVGSDSPSGHWPELVTWYADEWTLDVADEGGGSVVEPDGGTPDSGYRKGDKVRVKEAACYKYGARIRQPNVEVGQIYEVNRLPGDKDLAKGGYRHGNLTVLPGYYLALDAIELAESAPEETTTRSVADLIAAAEQHEEAIIALADDGVLFPERASRFLNGLDLEPIKPTYDGPVHVGSIVKLKDGRVAVICDTSDKPFKATYLNGEGYGRWLSVDDVARIGIERELHDNENYNEDHIQV